MDWSQGNIDALAIKYNDLLLFQFYFILSRK